jgi:RND family efflux transporter MFP subunit
MNEVPTAKPSPTPPPVRRLLRIALYVAIAGCIMAAWGLFSRLQARTALARSAEQAAIPTVAVTTPRHSSSGDELVLPGTVQAFTDAPIYARSSGYVRRWYADIGKSVKAGELLAEIETPEVDAQYRQAQADLATAEANNRLSQITAARYQTLRKSGLVAQQDVDNAQGDADAKKAQLDSARQNLSRLEQLESFNRITAPFEGVVTARRIDVGALVNAGMTSGEELFHLTATRRLRIYVNVPQSDAAAMVPGLMAELSVVEHPNQRFPAKVVSTARTIDPSSRTLLTELEADNAKGELLPGSFADVHLPLPASIERWRLPSNTLIFRGQGSEGLQVATVDAQNHVHLHQVSLGRDFGSEVEVLSGVGASDRVILNPLDSLADGATVRIVAGGG